MKFIFGLIGLYLGALIESWEGAIFGGCLGILFASYLQLKHSIQSIDEQLKNIRTNLIDSKVEVTASRPVEPRAIYSEADTSAEKHEQESGPAENVYHDDTIYQSESDVVTGPDIAETDDYQTPDVPEPASKLIRYIRDFFTTGNIVAKTGVIILIFGASFLVNYAIDRNLFPLEYRLIAIAAGSVVMFIIGWRLRHTKPGIALVLQGGGTGLLYLVIFAAAKPFILNESYQSLIQPEVAFLLMVIIVLFSGVMAVLQDSRVLAIMGTIGGFLAPILTSTGQGSHVILFSYYAFLNAGIFGIAWYKAWRNLNWLGFIFTFVIGSIWGIKYYQPEFFNTTEPFLILFYFFYVAIAVLFSLRQPPDLKGIVDGSLVFGVPLVGFTLQSVLVEDFQYGQAWSAFGLCVVYSLLTRFLWNYQNLKMLAESFLALAVIFGSLVIPFTFDGHWTAAAWALEGAGIAWIGIRQKRLLARLFGLLLQVGGAIAFLAGSETMSTDIAIINSQFIGSVFISIAGLFISYQLYRLRDNLKSWEQGNHLVMLVWGLGWWLITGFREIDKFLLKKYETDSGLMFLALSAFVLTILARRLDWRVAEFPAKLLLPVMFFIAIVLYIDHPDKNPFVNLGLIAWGVALAIQYFLLRFTETTWRRTLTASWHAGTLWLFIFITTWGIAQLVDDHTRLAPVWFDITWGMFPAIVVFILLVTRKKITWPLQVYQTSYYGNGLLPVIAWLFIWTAISCTNEGNPYPFRYIPVFNPLDIVQIYSLLMVYEWLRQIRTGEIKQVKDTVTKNIAILLSVTAFIWANSLIAHCVHFYLGTSYQFSSLFNSPAFQTSLSVFWTLIAFTLMGYASKTGFRKIWIVGAGLLVAVVIKLFLVDIKDTNTVAQIISFLTVGILMLVIDYFAPIPTRANKTVQV